MKRILLLALLLSILIITGVIPLIAKLSAPTRNNGLEIHEVTPEKAG
jgi:hypothetical protein